MRSYVKGLTYLYGKWGADYFEFSIDGVVRNVRKQTISNDCVEKKGK
jgi:hypothetical protein